MPSAILFDIYGTLADHAKSDAEAMTLLRQIVTRAGIRVSDQAMNAAEAFAVDAFAPLASMWAQLKIKVKVNAMPRATYFPKLEKLDTSMYMLGWGGAVTDAETTLTPVLRNPGDKGVGFYNYGRSRNDRFDELAAASSVEADPAKREQLVKAALREFKEQVHVIPLHRQVIPWAARASVNLRINPN